MKSFLLLLKILLLFDLFAAFVLSCSPESDGNPIAFVLSIPKTPQLWRLNIPNWDINNGPLICFPNDRPDSNEIYSLSPLTPAIYEILPVGVTGTFYRAYAVDGGNGDFFNTKNRNNALNQRFSIECGKCNLEKNTADWAPYHTLCNIKNEASGLCMNGAPIKDFKVGQMDCAKATKWDIWGIMSPFQNNNNIVTSNGTTISNSTTSTTSTSNIQLSTGGLVGIIIGTITATTLLTLVIGYLFIQRRPKFIERDPINVQFYENK